MFSGITLRYTPWLYFYNTYNVNYNLELLGVIPESCRIVEM